MTVRIGLISEHASPLAILGGVDSGGQNVYVGQVAKHLAALGYEVDVFTRRDAPDLPEVVDWAPGARVIHVPAGPPCFVRKEDLLRYMDAFTLGILRFARQEGLRYDLYHANFWMSGLVALNLKEIEGTPFAVTFHALGRVRRQHQGQADEFPDERFAVEDRVVAGADLIVAECPQDRQDLRELYGADPDRIVVVPAGFDPLEFWPVDKVEARRAVGLPPGEQIVLQLGRMVRRKGVANVIRAFARLAGADGRRESLRLVIVGGESDEPDPRATPEIGRLQAIAEEEGIADRVLFVGRRGRDLLPYYYSAADVFVTTPWYEPFGMTPLEAMACARPVVGAEVGGIKYTVRDGETGYLVPPRDPTTLAERLGTLLDSPHLLDDMGRRALERARELFTWERVAASLAEAYQAVLAPAALTAGSLPAEPEEEAELAVVDQGFQSALEATLRAWPRLRGSLVDLARLVAGTFAAGGQVLIAGNGGSAAEAQHLAAELVGRFVLPGRPALPAMALGTDPAVLTAWSNDVAYEEAFARQVEAFGRPGDLLLGLSTSGCSPNLVRAFEAAGERGMRCSALLGGDGGDLLPLCDVAVLVPEDNAQRIQELHTLAVHLICELVEADLAAAEAEMEAGTWNGQYAEYASPLSSLLDGSYLQPESDGKESKHG
ncbi:MAG: glycosyltransferase [Anaerolineae bacterium]|nr:glycosyltransferase [Anaerolineae bacterium]